MHPQEQEHLEGAKALRKQEKASCLSPRRRQTCGLSGTDSCAAASARTKPRQTAEKVTRKLRDDYATSSGYLREKSGAFQREICEPLSASSNPCHARES